MDVTPDRVRRRAAPTLFKKGADNKVLNGMELGVSLKVMIEK